MITVETKNGKESPSRIGIRKGAPCSCSVRVHPYIYKNPLLIWNKSDILHFSENKMIAELGFNDTGHFAHRQGESSILKRRNHLSAAKLAEVSTIIA